MTKVLGNCHLVSVFRSDLQRDGAWHSTRLGCSRRLCSLGYVLVHRDDPNIAQYSLACDPLANGSAGFDVLSQDHVNPVARPDQPGDASCCIHTDRDRARTGLQDSCEETAVTDPNYIIPRYRHARIYI